MNTGEKMLKGERAAEQCAIHSVYMEAMGCRVELHKLLVAN
jgi:hypothetical protein